MQMLGSRGGGSAGFSAESAPSQSAPAPATASAPAGDFDDDIPF